MPSSFAIAARYVSRDEVGSGNPKEVLAASVVAPAWAPRGWARLAPKDDGLQPPAGPRAPPGAGRLAAGAPKKERAGRAPGPESLGAKSAPPQAASMPADAKAPDAAGELDGGPTGTLAAPSSEAAPPVTGAGKVAGPRAERAGSGGTLVCMGYDVVGTGCGPPREIGARAGEGAWAASAEEALGVRGRCDARCTDSRAVLGPQ